MCLYQTLWSQDNNVDNGTLALLYAHAMKFEVVPLGLTCACMNYNAREARVLGGSWGMLPQENVGFQAF